MKPNELAKTDKREKFILIILLVLIALLSIVPIFKGYITDSGEALLWSLRIKKILPDGIADATFLIVMAILKILLVISAYLFFKTYFGKSGYIIHLIGTALFIFSPYQVYIAYDKYDFTDVALWICILWFAVSLSLLITCIKTKKNAAKALLSAALCVFMLAGMAVTYLVSYVSMSALSFEGRGYVLGELFTSFFYMENHPGLGISIIAAVVLWICISLFGPANEKNIVFKAEKRDLIFFIAGILFAFLSLVVFPWDIIIREIPILGKIIIRLEEPTIFAGLAGFCFCIPATKGLEYTGKSEHTFINKIVPTVIVFMAVLVGMYLMSEGMYWQSPLDISGI